MIADDDLRIRIGRIRNRGSSRRSRPFIAQALAAAERAGGLRRRSRRSPSGSAFGRGRAAAASATRRLGDRARRVTLKARIVRQSARGASLGKHLAYLRREGVTRDGTAGRMFDTEHDDADHRAFAERCRDDRHHFRFIVSPQDAERLGDLRAYMRDLMVQAERDLGTRLDWIAVDHWNTDNPHIHLLLRGKGDDGRDLVIARDYISQGLRARAAHLATLELGPRSEVEIRRDLDVEVQADRWSGLDRTIARIAGEHDGVVDLRPGGDGATSGGARSAMVARMRKLEQMGLVEPLGPAHWHLSERAEPTLRALGERDDIIKRIHRGLAAHGIERGPEELVLNAAAQPFVGRLLALGLDDELKETAYAVIDAVDGRAHHVRLANLDAAGDAASGAIVELRQFNDAAGRQRVALAVRSDLPLAALVEAEGATWLDRQLLGRHPAPLATSGFGQEVRDAMTARVEHLIGQGLAKRQGQRAIFARDLLDTLCRRELEATAAGIAANCGLVFRGSAEGEVVAGVYRQRYDLASGRFAMIDDGLGFSLVPWSPSLERHLGREVAGIAHPGRVDWSFARARGLGI